MKQLLGLVLIFALFILLTPAIALISPDRSAAGGTPGDLFQTAENQDGSADAPADQGEMLVVLNEADGQLLQLTMREYLIGAVTCEMPALYEPEALKAQAVAAHTYALYVQQMREASPLPELMGASFTVDTSSYTGYMTREQAELHFGADFDTYYTKIEQAVDAVLQETLQYDGQLISACYHAISPGRTENSENVFSSALPYLVSVDSEWDKTSPDYETTAVFTPSELDDLLRLGRSDFAASGDAASWLGDYAVTEAGTVTRMTICGTDFTGTELRSLLGLRSAAFTAAYADGEFTFTVHGYGHGVGMSQYGANCLAQQGKSYAEILAHYYPGTELVSSAA